MILGAWTWDGDILRIEPPAPCFALVRFGVRCRRPRGHDGACATRPLEGEETAPTSAEVTAAYGRRRHAKLRKHGVARLCDIPGTPAYWREVHRQRRAAARRAR